MKAISTIQPKKKNWGAVLYLPDQSTYVLGCSTKKKNVAVTEAKSNAIRLEIPFVDYGDSFIAIKPLGQSFIAVEVSVMEPTTELSVAASNDFNEISQEAKTIAEQKNKIFVPNFFLKEQ